MKLAYAIAAALAFAAPSSFAHTLQPNTARETFQSLEQANPGEIWTVKVQYFDESGLERLVKLVDRPWKVDRVAGVAIIGIDSVSVYDQLIAAGLRVELDAQATEFMRQVNSVDSLRTIPNFSCYRTVEESYDAATALVAQKPAIAEWLDIGDTELKEANPANGYDMRVLRLTNRSIPGTTISGRKPTLLIFGAIHAREYVTAETVTRFAERLVNGYGTDPNITWTLDQHEVHLVLVANPDGRKVAETQSTRMQRKNRNPLFTCATNNVLTGVDLNRNYSFDFGIGSTINVCSDTTNGGGAFNQNETAALSAYSQQIFPDQRVEASVTPGDYTTSIPLSVTGTFIDVHSFAGETLFPWGSTSNTAPNASQLQSYARRMGFYNEMPAAKSSVLGAIGGATDDWIYGTLGVPGFTFELKDGGGQFFPTCTYYEASISNQVQQSFLYAMRAVRNPLQLATGPEVITLAAARGATDTVITASATDVRSLPNTEPAQNISAVEIYQTPPWVAGSTPIASFAATDGSFNATTEGVTLTLANSTLPNATTMFYVRARDNTNTWGPVSGVFLGSDEQFKDGFE